MVVDLSMLKDAPMNRVVLGGCIFSKRMGSGMIGGEEGGHCSKDGENIPSRNFHMGSAHK